MAQNPFLIYIEQDEATQNAENIDISSSRSNPFLKYTLEPTFENVPLGNGRSAKDRIAGTLIALGEGTPVGSFIDETSAGIGSLFGGPDYSQRLQNIRGAQQAFKKENPNISIGLNILGGLPGGGILANRALQGAKQMGPLASASRSALEGLGLGALYGFGSGEGGLAERVAGSGLGASIGAIGGAISPLAIGGISRIGRGVLDIVNPSDAAKRQAQSRAAQVFEGGGESAQDILQSLKDAPEMTTISDISPMARSEAERLATIDAGIFKKAQEFFNARQSGEPERIAKNISELVSEQDFRETIESLINVRKRNASSLYKKAYDTPLNINSTEYKKLQEISQRPKIKKAIKEYVDEILGRTGEPLPQNISLDEEGNIILSDITTEVADFVKKSLDNDYDRLMRGASPSKQAAKATLQVKKEILDALDSLNPAYKEARDKFAGEIALQNALEAGEDIFKGKHRQFQDIVDNLTDSERSMYLVGVANTLKEDAMKAGPGGEARKLLSGDKKERVLKLFKDKKQGEQFVKNLESELNFRATKNQVVGGSPTARRQFLEETAQRSGIGGLARDIHQSGGVLPALGKSGANLADDIFADKNLAQQEALINILLNPNRQSQMKSLEEIGNLARNIERSNIASRVLGNIGARSSAPVGFNFINQSE